MAFRSPRKTAPYQILTCTHDGCWIRVLHGPECPLFIAQKSSVWVGKDVRGQGMGVRGE